MTTPTILQGYSYPGGITLAAVIAHEARQGRTVEIAIEHAGGWTVTGEGAGAGCTCRGYPGDDDGCPVHGEPITLDKLTLCPDCGKPWLEAETIRAGGELGCP